MTCPFAPRRNDSLNRQPSVAEGAPLNLDEDLIDSSDDALSLRHLHSAIQLLTSPSNDDINVAVSSLITKYNDSLPFLRKLKIDSDILASYPNYDYLADIQDSLLRMDESLASEIIVLLGEELIKTCCTGIIDRAFRSLGADLNEFLGALDGVYDVLKLQEEESTDTDFVCAAEGELIFTSERPVIAWLLLGSLKALINSLYGINASVTIQPVEGDLKRYRYLFSVTDENVSATVKTVEQAVSKYPQRSISNYPNDLIMGAATFCKAFPWHFVIDENLNLVQLGKGFSSIIKPYMAVKGKSMGTYICIKRPKGITQDFREIVRRINTPFLISFQELPGKSNTGVHGLEIKGQMVHCAETNSLMFMGSPFLHGLDGLTCNGLFISDIPIHDATREVILVGEQARAQDGLRRRMDKLKNSIEEGNKAVMKERKKNVSLLHLIFPAEIAEKLWLGYQIDAKTYPNVTMLFSDIVGFTSICSRATPFMVINMLEDLYKDFDEFCGYFDVYKVETIGDAYCVASGLHRASIYDAHKVAWMALKMIEACGKHLSPDSEHIQMRIGIHTGTVLTGVVGRKMPRYCLFGHNVTLANKFESGSVARRINISPTTEKWLMKYPAMKFDLEERSPDSLPKDYPRVGDETCYFLDGYQHDGVDPSAPLHDHIEAAMSILSVEN